MFDFRNPTSPEDMHARAETGLRDDPVAEYNADYQVDAASMVNELAPVENQEACMRDPWLDRNVGYYGGLDIEGRQMHDPVLYVVREDKAYGLGAEYPEPPLVAHCDYCQKWNVEDVKQGLQTERSKRAVGRVRFRRGARVIEFLFCVPCIARLRLKVS